MVTSFDVKDFHVPTTHPDFQYFVYQIEMCPTTKREHVQGYLELKKQVAFNQVKLMFSPAIVHLEQRRAKTNTKAIEYCTKSDTRLRGPWHFGEATDMNGASRNPIDWLAIRNKLWTFETWTSVMRSDDPDIVRALGHKSAHCKELYLAKPVNTPEPQITLRKWQKKVLTMLEEKPVKRRIIWIWSEASGTGKTTFFDYCSAKYEVIPGADWANTLFVYDGQPITWFDRTRAQQWDDKGVNDFYSMLERLSNSTIHTSTKYQPVRKFISCHVVVTANCKPDETRLPGRCVTILAKTTAEEEAEEEEVLRDFENQIEEEYVRDLCKGNVIEIPDHDDSMDHEAQPQPAQSFEDHMHNSPTPPNSPPSSNPSPDITLDQPDMDDPYWKSVLNAAYGSPENFVTSDVTESEDSESQ